MPNSRSSLDVGSSGTLVNEQTGQSFFLWVHVRFSEGYIHFALMYMTDHIFPVLPIKYLINKNDDLTTPFKLETGTKPSVSHLSVLFCTCVVRKATAHVDKKALNICCQADLLVSPGYNTRRHQ